MDPTEQRRLLTAFVQAAQAGDLSALEDLFAEDVVSYSDGGGVARATKVVVTGAEQVAKLIRAWGSSPFWTGLETVLATLNGAPAMVLKRADETIGVVAVAGSTDGIDQVMWVINPAKLTAA